MNVAYQYRPRYTVADYGRWEGDWELIDGLAIDMGPSPFGPHGAMLAELVYQFKAGLKSSHVDALEVLVEIDWIVSDSTVVRPDLAIVSKPIEEEHIQSPPFLVAEVVSSSTAEKDRSAKFEIYQHHGVRYYLIADPVAKELQIFQLVDGRYQLQPFQAQFAFTLVDGRCLTVDLRCGCAGS